MTDSREQRGAEIQDAIRQVLFREWDPIGVNGNPKLSDEYDSFIAGVYRILVASRSEDDLMAYLFKAEEGLGVQCQSPEQLRPVARSLLALDVKLGSHAA
jgi:hypothetical protein